MEKDSQVNRKWQHRMVYALLENTQGMMGYLEGHLVQGDRGSDGAVSKSFLEEVMPKMSQNI
jgi:hypothetical protein